MNEHWTDLWVLSIIFRSNRTPLNHSVLSFLGGCIKNQGSNKVKNSREKYVHRYRNHLQNPWHRSEVLKHIYLVRSILKELYKLQFFRIHNISNSCRSIHRGSNDHTKKNHSWLSLILYQEVWYCNKKSSSQIFIFISLLINFHNMEN